MTATVLIDISKAFDSVNHEIILDKLEKSNMSNFCKVSGLSHICMNVVSQ